MPGCGSPWAAARVRRSLGLRGTARGPRAASRRGASRPDASRKGAVCGLRVAQNALFRHVAAREAWGATPRQPAGHYGKWPNWANVLGQPPARLAGGCARVRRPRPGAWLHGKTQSGQRASLRAHPGPGRDTIGLPVVGYGGAGNSGLTNHEPYHAPTQLISLLFNGEPVQAHLYASRGNAICIVAKWGIWSKNSANRRRRGTSFAIMQ